MQNDQKSILGERVITGNLLTFWIRIMAISYRKTADFVSRGSGEPPDPRRSFKAQEEK